jgi:hypothetical protein
MGFLEPGPALLFSGRKEGGCRVKWCPSKWYFDWARARHDGADESAFERETQQLQQAYTCAYARAEKTIRPECSPMFAVMALILLLTRESDPGHGGERVNAIAHG